MTNRFGLVRGIFVVLMLLAFTCQVGFAKQLAGYTTLYMSNKSGIFPKIELGGGGTGIAFVNTEDTSATVTLTAYNDSGSRIASETMTVPGKSKIVDVPTNIFKNTDISQATYLSYSSDKTVVGFQLNISSDRSMLDGLPALTGTSETIYYPRTISNNQWDAEVCIINADPAHPLAGALVAYDSSGDQLLQTIPVALAAGGRLEVKIGNTFLTPEDVAYLRFVPVSGTAVGYAKFFVEGEYRGAVPAITVESTNQLYISHIASTDIWWTQIALVNTTQSSKIIEIDFDNGTKKSLTFSPFQQKVFKIRELFGGTAQPNIHSAVIKNSANFLGLEIFGDNDQLSGIKLSGMTAAQLYYPHIASQNG